MRALLALLFAVLALPLWAQERPLPTLIADQIDLDGDARLIARGNVEVLQDDLRLTAEGLIYDANADRITFEGPLTLTQGTQIAILASAAELSVDLRDGLLRSARLVLGQRVQLAAQQIDRRAGRYTQLHKTAVTSCRVCADGRAPLWQIRARRVVHDQEAQQLYFEDAQFLIRDVPVFYLPYLRLPDPTVTRATGFLNPSIRNTSQLGSGVRIPYFFRLGDHRDLTLTPYLSRDTRTLEFRYRQAFVPGRLTFEGAFTRDTLLSGQDRWYVFGAGLFDLGRQFELSFDLKATSDDAYLTQYNYSDDDRLVSQLSVSRTLRDSYTLARIVGVTSLRALESDRTLPTVIFDTRYEQRLFPQVVGGELRLSLAAHAHLRTSESETSGEGRDVARVHGDLTYLRQATFGPGLRLESQLALQFDAFETAQDAVFAGTVTNLVPQAAVALRYPLSKTTQSGAVHFVEPVMQLGWSGGDQADVANDESTRVEFDEGNLLALSRFPEDDRRELGAVLALGASWARYDPAGWESSLSFGHIIRERDNADLTSSSGLDGLSSDFLLAGQLRRQNGLALAGRMLFDERFDFSKAELRGDWEGETLRLGGSYIWLVQDAAEERDKAISELTLDGAYKVNDDWTLLGNWRYDVEDDRTARAGVGFGFLNECVAMEFTVDRRFTSSTSVEPETSFGFKVSLRGFSAAEGTESTSRSCS